MSSKKIHRLPKAKRYHVRSKDREYFAANMSLLLKAGVPVSAALGSLADTSRSRSMKGAMKQMQGDIDEGLPLWRTLERSGIVSEQTLALVQLGEQSGKLADNMQVAAKQEEKQRLFKSKVRSALLYPLFVMSLTLIVGIGVAWFLLPRLSTTFAQLDLKLPLITRIFMKVGEFLKVNGLWAVPSMIGGGIFLGYLIFAAPGIRTLGNRMLFHVPGVSKLMYEVEIARFGYLLGTLLDSGLSVTQSLGLLRHATRASRYKKFYRYLYQSFEDGHGFRVSLPKYRGINKLVPPAVQQMLIAGERSGALADTLREVGQIYEDKADVSTKNLEVVLEPILLLIVWVGVLGVAVAVIIPIYSLIGGLDQ